MAKRKKSPPFVMIPKEMIRSEAWKSLSHYSVRTYIEIAAKYNGNNERNLSYTYQEAEMIMNRRTFKKGIDELVEFGFIDVIRSGRLNRVCNLYALSRRWQFYGTSQFVPGQRVVIGC
jgi:hypothetical protein